jgi:hypothetical protein
VAVAVGITVDIPNLGMVTLSVMVDAVAPTHEQALE